MIAFIIKSIVCSGILFGIYILFFEQETNHRFKRFYLIASLLFSFAIPIFHFELKSEVSPMVTPVFVQHLDAPSINLDSVNMKANNPFNPTKYLCAIYLFAAFFLLIRFAKNSYKIYNSISNNEKVKLSHYKAVLIDNLATPYSFLNFVFLNKFDYLNNQIDPQILRHEQTHITQRHTLDIMLIELLKIIFWFNPFVGLYKKAMQTNHEYLADQDVIKTYHDVYSYQQLLFQTITQNHTINLTSSFNYLTTKKRLIMMTRTTSKNLALCKQFAIVPLLALLVLLFSEKTIAQESKPISVSQQTLKSAGEGINEEEMKTYKAIEEKNLTLSKSGTHKIWKGDISDSDKSSLKALYFKMSKEQQRQVTFAFIKYPGPLKVSIPTHKQFEALKNKNEYGIWIDEKKVDNDELNKYKASDFKQLFISKLYGDAKKNRIYNYQADLMTVKFYDHYIAESLANKDKYLLITQSYSKLGSK